MSDKKALLKTLDDHGFYLRPIKGGRTDDGIKTTTYVACRDGKQTGMALDILMDDETPDWSFMQEYFLEYVLSAYQLEPVKTIGGRFRIPEKSK